jgi:uncharacterized protein YqjF (DUF2071 family)
VADDFDFSILLAVDHRPWPLPAAPWTMRQTWVDLLFAHWPLPEATLRPLVPAAFSLDLFDGAAWVGVVPFAMRNVSARGLPALPWLSRFPELNVRTYVRVGDRPGVFFFSLDAGRALAVLAARWALNLPYHHASMRVRVHDGAVEYRSVRRGRAAAALQARYHATGPVRAAAPGTLEYFLTERYCLFHLDRGQRPYRLDIHHPPWPLQPAGAELVRNTMASSCGLTLPGGPPLLHFARRQDMVAWPPTRRLGG